jgi:MoaA/NifB/PqqE/SkfB family radical SAM enzyme
VIRKAISIYEATKKFGWFRYNPKQCEVTLTLRCNAKCIHCYTPFNINKKDFLEEEIIKQIYTSYQNGARFLTLTGGEPTLFPNLNKIIYFSKKIGYKSILLNTNGIKLSDSNYFKSLTDVGLDIVKISLHSNVKDIHEKILGIKDSFNKTLKAIENAIKLGIFVEGNCVVTSLNYKTLPELFEFGAKEFGISNCAIFFHPKGNAYLNKELLKISYSEHIPYLKLALQKLLDYKITPSCHPLGNYLPCILPGYEHLIMDWEKDGKINEDLCYIDDENTKTIKEIQLNGRIKTKKCRKCIYFDKCVGFEKEYFETFGDKEFIPILKKTKPFALQSFYYPIT